MTRKLLVVADLGRFKAYRFEQDPKFSHPRLELLEDWETGVTHHLSEEVNCLGARTSVRSSVRSPAHLTGGQVRAR